MSDTNNTYILAESRMENYNTGKLTPLNCVWGGQCDIGKRFMVRIKPYTNKISGAHDPMIMDESNHTHFLHMSTMRKSPWGMGVKFKVEKAHNADGIKVGDIMNLDDIDTMLIPL